MNKTYLLAIVAALVAAPLAFAHTNGDPYGLPKTYCEDTSGVPSEMLYHDFSPGVDGMQAQDGSLGPQCPYSAGSTNPTFDGHYEWAPGGAWFVADNGDGQTYGALVCGWPYADHPALPTVWGWDHVLSQIPADVSFSVYADTINHVPPVDPNEPNCGDFESDFGVDCVNHCTVGFPPGLDGTYQVYAHGVMGHFWTNPR